MSLLATIVGMLFTAYALVQLGIIFYKKINSNEKYKESKLIGILPFTFFIYGGLQFSYPFKLIFSQNVLLSIFVVASILKLLNIAGMIAMLTRINFPQFKPTQEYYL